MPIYEFECKKCKNDFEELVFNSSEKIECPECGSKKVRRKMSTFAFKSSGKFTSTSSGSDCSSCSSGNCATCH